MNKNTRPVLYLLLTVIYVYDIEWFIDYKWIINVNSKKFKEWSYKWCWKKDGVFEILDCSGRQARGRKNLLQEKTEIQKLFKTQLKNTDNSAIIVSAFITNYGFNFVNEYLDDSVREKVVIFRGRLDDFKQEATEFDFKKALNNGWKIFINLGYCIWTTLSGLIL